MAYNTLTINQLINELIRKLKRYPTDEEICAHYDKVEAEAMKNYDDLEEL